MTWLNSLLKRDTNTTLGDSMAVTYAPPHPGSNTNAALYPGNYDRILDSYRRANSGYINSLGATQPPSSESMVDEDHWRHNALGTRLRLHQGARVPFQHLSHAHVNGKVFVFIVQNNQAVTLEDSAEMFPSDTLISALNLLRA